VHGATAAVADAQGSTGALFIVKFKI